MLKIILASQSKVRKKILDEHNILNEVKPSNVDEDVVKISLLKERASPEIISKNFEKDFPKSHKHLMNLYNKDDFQKFMKGYLDGILT